MKISRQRYLDSINQAENIKILVIGDLILDEYLMGEVNRISPEAPVPIVLVKKSKTTLGGAGNVVKNLTAFNIKTGIIGRVGTDPQSDVAEELLTTPLIAKTDKFLIKDKNIPTTLKTRIIASHQQVCRVDREIINPLSDDDEEKIITYLKNVITTFKAIILSDYDKGFLTPSLIKKIISIAQQNNIYVSADPQVSHFFMYEGISIMTPNHHEAGNAISKKLTDEKEIENANVEICEKLNSESMMITRGDKGMSIYIKNTNKHFHISTVAREVFDVTGAGDTVISLFTLFKILGLTELESAIIANAGAGVVVQKVGAETVTREELLKSLSLAGYLDENS